MSGRRLINRALKRIAAEQQAAHDEAERRWKAAGGYGPNFSSGLQSEGYVGGYRDALNDVLLAMNGVTPNRRGWWDKPLDIGEKQ